MNYIVDEAGFWSSNDQEVLQAIKKGFLECHLAMWKDLGKFCWLFWFESNMKKLERDFSFHPVAFKKCLFFRPSIYLFIWIHSLILRVKVSILMRTSYDGRHWINWVTNTSASFCLHQCHKSSTHRKLLRNHRLHHNRKLYLHNQLKL